ncbi:hypothetical protein CC80DRAFT_48306 [Byssothecium circinans]|uniref:Uncharacterized protein n=1 Tax=Byssothecium circinans TaxID=147558 RepID=A0A6A5U3S5_9PLEO|nr:hypothetical protein CC80DRAFT_48306 [Byssothecium circinans]
MASKTPFLSSEKRSLLPVAEPSQLLRQENDHSEAETDADLSTTTLTYASLALIVVLLLLLNAFHLLPRTSPLFPYTALIASGIQTSAWASLPAPVVLFIYAPYLAQPGRVAQMRYLTFLFYLVGTCVGGLMFGLDLKEAVIALGRVYGGNGLAA